MFFTLLRKPVPHNVILPDDQYAYSKLTTVIADL